jgi:hypothetical protein
MHWTHMQIPRPCTASRAMRAAFSGIQWALLPIVASTTKWDQFISSKLRRGSGTSRIPPGTLQQLWYVTVRCDPPDMHPVIHPMVTFFRRYVYVCGLWGLRRTRNHRKPSPQRGPHDLGVGRGVGGGEMFSVGPQMQLPPPPGW